MIWTREQAKTLIDRALSLSKAEQTFVVLNGLDRGNLRFARNTATTSGASSRSSLAITAIFGKKSGTATTAEFDDVSLRQAIANAEEIARLSPDNPEAMPVLGPQPYGTSKAYFEDVANVTADWRAAAAATAIDLSKQKGVVSAGFVDTSASIQAAGSSKGLFGYDRQTSADYNLTARTADGSGSGWASKSFNELRLLEPAKLASAAIDKAVLSKDAAAIEPGKYTVVLEPAALGDLLAGMLFSADARQSDEGRSFFSRKGGGNRIGEQVLSEKVTLYSDPSHPLAPCLVFDREGLPITRTSWVEKGVWKDLLYSRFWAQKQNREPTGGPVNLIMDGGTAPIADLIAGTDRGVLVTRFWYIRPLDPQTLLFTGLTRDGLFLIEKGKVTRPVKNMRWNESPIAALNNVDAMTPAERTVTGEGFGGSDGFTFGLVCPAARIREFTFASASDAI
jgi:predicted Zn-dependent protease